MNLPEKAEKLLRLAIDLSSPEGEWKNAAVMFVANLRKQGWTLVERKQEDESPRINQFLRLMKMPFGKHKGIEIRYLPIEYVEWMAENLELKGSLKSAIEQELAIRQ